MHFLLVLSVIAGSVDAGSAVVGRVAAVVIERLDLADLSFLASKSCQMPEVYHMIERGMGHTRIGYGATR
jgi:hypothetical protein